MSGLRKLISCQLPGGYIDQDGKLHQDAEVVSLNGRDEEFLSEEGRHVSAELATSILSRCVTRIGTIQNISKDIIRKLLVADRQYLLLKIREATFGDHISTTILCPWPDCGKKVDIDFSTKDIPIKESPIKGAIHNIELSSEAHIIDQDGIEHQRVYFRLPNGEDQELVSPLIEHNESAAMTALFRRCILAIDTQDKICGEIVSMLNPLARLEIEREMEAIAPKVEMNMEATCLECGRTFIIPFDLQDFFFGECRLSLDLLYREVHYLAYHYHWSEGEIMGMTREKRRQYIDVLIDEIERMNNAV